ncbi:hypothetical protein B0H14DRAFT_2576060 [Mycena olivaceomarginata]|nr:hypothetical protein B0H14DRAFT_2576060 [Mycena olivaceomarginata]
MFNCLGNCKEESCERELWRDAWWIVDTSSSRLHSLESILRPERTTQRNGAFIEHLCYVSIGRAQGPNVDGLENTRETLGGRVVDDPGRADEHQEGNGYGPGCRAECESRGKDRKRLRGFEGGHWNDLKAEVKRQLPYEDGGLWTLEITGRWTSDAFPTKSGVRQPSQMLFWGVRQNNRLVAYDQIADPANFDGKAEPTSAVKTQASQGRNTCFRFDLIFEVSESPESAPTVSNIGTPKHQIPYNESILFLSNRQYRWPLSEGDVLLFWTSAL